MATTEQLIPNNYRLTMAKKFVQSFTDASNSVYYAFAGVSVPYANSDTVIPPLYDTPYETGFGAYQSMVFGKHILPTDTAYMAKLVNWESNTVYAMYDDQDSALASKNFYVVTNESNTHYAYKCLYNAGGVPSTSQPTFSDTSASDTFYQTNDGYQWKYMFQVDSADYQKWATANSFPITPDANVTGNAVAGAIDVVIVTAGGAEYNNYTSGQFSVSDIFSSNQYLYAIDSAANSTNGFYDGCYIVLTGGSGQGEYSTVTSYTVNTSGKFITIYPAFSNTPSATTTFDISPAVTILGDGNQTVNAAARALVNSAASNTVWFVEMLERGKGYQSATGSVVSANVVGVTNTAQVRVIMSPEGGHGADAYSEFECSTVGISVSFVTSESNTIPVSGAYRQVGIIRDPLFANVTLALSSATGNFTDGEKVTQANTGAVGIISDLATGSIQLTNASGFFVTGNSTYGLVSGNVSGSQAEVTTITNNDAEKGFETFCALYRHVGTLESGSFVSSEVVTLGNTATTNAYFHSYFPNTSTIALTQQLGSWLVPNTIQGTANGGYFSITETFGPDIVVNSGKVIYMENMSPRNRSNIQTETVKLLLQF
jgi:hypothetical protein